MSEIKSVNELFDSAEEPVLSDTDESTVGEPIDNTVNTEQEQTPQPTETIQGQQTNTRSLMDLSNAAAVTAIDVVDNLFQGNQKTREDINQQIESGKQKKEEDRANAGVVGKTLQYIGDIPKAISGAYTGYLEEGAEAIEWAGDVLKTGISKATPFDLYTVADSNNPFSDKYQWAQWDLGKDELGAQTGTGKVVQGFLEFGMILARTGGLGGLKNAPAKFNAAKGIAQKAKVVTKTGLVGGAYGIPADFIVSLTEPEQSNLSNLVKDNMPDWYPTWLTALAIDDDDNPYEAAFKTTIEGFGLGFGIDANGAWIGGHRAYRKALKEGLSKEAAEKVAFETAKEISDAGQPFNPSQWARELNETDLANFKGAIKGDIQLSDAEDSLKALRSLPAREQFKYLRENDLDHSLASVQAQISASNSADKFFDLPNGSRIQFTFRTDNLQGYQRGSKKVLNVEWNVDYGTTIKKGSNVIEGYGRNLITQFQKFAREELSPGTILINHPEGDFQNLPKAFNNPNTADGRRVVKQLNLLLKENPEVREKWIQRAFNDQVTEKIDVFQKKWDSMSTVEKYNAVRNLTFGEYIDGSIYKKYFVDALAQPNKRSKIYKSAGFGNVNAFGEQVAVVRKTPDSRGRWLKPVDTTAPNVDFGEVGDQDLFKGLNDAVASEIDVFRDVEREIARSGRRGPGNRDELYQVLLDQHLKGIPVTWDDVAKVFPEYFTPGVQPIADAFHPNVIEAIRNTISDEIGGFSLNPFTGEQITSGFAVAIDGEVLDVVDTLDEDLFRNFITKNAAIFSRGDVVLGGYKMNDGTIRIEISRIVNNKDEATLLGKLFDQESIVEINGNELDFEATFGKDTLKDTKFDNLKSPEAKPHEVRPSDSTTSLSEQIKGDSAPPGVRTGSQRTLTNAQIRLIGNATDEGVETILRDEVVNNPIDVEELTSIVGKPKDEILQKGLKLAADAMGENGVIDFNKIDYKNPGEPLLSGEGIQQVRRLLQETSQSLWDSSYQIVKLGDANLDAFPQIKLMADQWKALMKIHKVSASYYGRMLSEYKVKLPTGENMIPPKAPSADELASNIKNGEKVIDDLLKKISSGDVKAQNDALKLAHSLLLADGDPSLMKALWKSVLGTGGQYSLNMMYNSLLSGPATHIVNTLSNAINTIYRPVAAFTGGDVKSKKMAMAGFYGFQNILYDSTNMAWRVIQNGGKAINDGGKGLKMSQEVDAKLKLMATTAEQSGDPGLKAASGVVHTLKAVADFPPFAWPSQLLVTSDEFFKTMVSRMEYNSRIMGEAIEQAGDGKNVDDVFKHLLEKHVDKNFDKVTGEVLNKDLLSVAKETTFQTELDGWARSFAVFVDQVPIMRPFFPFVKTGHNIMVYSASHVPILNRSLVEYKAVMAGEDEYAKAIMKGREAYGSLMIMGGAMAAYNGLITGNAPPDPEQRKVWLQTNQERSIKVGTFIDKDGNKKTKWVRYDRIEPLGQLLAGTADIVYALKTGQLSEDRARYLSGYLTYALAANFTKKSYFQGIVPLGRMLTPGWQGLDTLATLPLEVANNFFPLASARRTFANAFNPYYQEFNDRFDRAIYSATGGLVGGSDAYDWLTGEKIVSDNYAFNSISPLKVNDRGASIVHDKLEDIEFDSSIIVKSLSGVKLNAKQKSRLMQLMGESGLYKELEKWVTHPNFDQAVENFKEKLRNGQKIKKQNEYFYKQITKIIRKYRDGALRQVKAEFPELKAELDQQKLWRNQQKTFNNTSQQVQNLTNF